MSVSAPPNKKVNMVIGGIGGGPADDEQKIDLESQLI